MKSETNAARIFARFASAGGVRLPLAEATRRMALVYAAVLFDLYGTLVDDRGDAMPGAARLAAALAGARWAVVTSCPRRLAEGLLHEAGLEAPFVIAADDVKWNKPAPEGYLLAARRLHAEAARTLVVEDSEHGIAAGVAAGMDVVAVLRGRERRFAREASFTVANLAALRLRANGADVYFEP